jgi:hypothetical protein
MKTERGINIKPQPEILKGVSEKVRYGVQR